MAGSIYQLPTINADTNAGTGAMSGASESFSRAGTVFGELRKSILDEEQRRIENEFKQKQFDENVRQFGETLSFHRDQLGETSRHNKVSELLSKMSNDITAQHYRWSHEDALQRNRIAAEGNNELKQARIAQAQLANAEKQDKALQRRYLQLGAMFPNMSRSDQESTMKTLGDRVKNGDPYAPSALAMLSKMYTNPSTNPMDSVNDQLAYGYAITGNESYAKDLYAARKDQLAASRDVNKNINEMNRKIADSTLALANKDLSRRQTIGMTKNADLFKSLAAQHPYLKDKVIQFNVPQTMLDLANDGGTTASWFGWASGNPGASLSFGEFGGDIGSEDSTFIGDGDMTPNRWDMSSRALLKNMTANGEPVPSSVINDLYASGIKAYGKLYSKAPEVDLSGFNIDESDY